MGELRRFCSRASSSVLTCVFVCVRMSRYGQATGTSLRVCQNGRGRGGRRWEVDREMTRRKEKMVAPVSQSALGSSEMGCGG